MYNGHMFVTKLRLLAITASIVLLAACAASTAEQTPVPATATAGLHAASPVAALQAAAAPPTVMPPRPTASPTPVRYTVQEGDTLFVIALNYGVTLEAIAAANQIDNPELIHPGQVLVIPTGPSPQRVKSAAMIAAPGTYIVQSGDSLFAIALEYGITVESIVVANQVQNPEFIRPGQVLIIPTESLSQPQPAATQNPVKPGPAATPPPLPQGQVTVNGVPLNAFVVLPPAVRQNIREVYRKGQTLGRNPRSFARVGDSTVENGFFLMAFDQRHYNLGNYAYLQPAIDYFSGSFARESVAVGRGFHTTTVLDPQRPNPACASGETLVECELRLTNPGVVVIRLGANDVGMPDVFARKLRQMVELALSKGVIPLLGTKADRQDPDNTINNTIRQVAAEYKLPLWDFDVVAQTMPNRGLASDGVHPTIGLGRDYTRPDTFQYGHAMQDLTALMALDAIWREVNPKR